MGRVLSASKPRECLPFVHKTNHRDDHRGTRFHFTGGKAKAIRTPPAPQSLAENRDEPRAAGSLLELHNSQLLKSLETEANSLEDHSVLSCFFKNAASLITGSEDCTRTSRFLSSVN